MAVSAACAELASVGLLEKADTALDAELIWEVALAAWLVMSDGRMTSGTDNDDVVVVATELGVAWSVLIGSTALVVRVVGLAKDKDTIFETAVLVTDTATGAADVEALVDDNEGVAVNTPMEIVDDIAGNEDGVFEVATLVTATVVETTLVDTSVDDASSELVDDPGTDSVKLAGAEIADVELIGFGLDVVLWRDMEAVDEVWKLESLRTLLEVV